MSQSLARLAFVTGLCVASLIAFTQEAEAQAPVFGNFAFPSTATANSGSGRSLNGGEFHSVRFTTGSQPIAVVSATATLATFSLTSTSVATFGIYSNLANGNPGTLLFSFGTRTITNAFGGATEPDYLFSPGGSFTLLAGTTYHLRGSSVSNETIWMHTNPSGSGIPTASGGSGMTYSAFRGTTNFGGAWSDDGSTQRFQLNGFAVPEAGTLPLVLPALFFAGAIALRRKRSRF